MIPHRIFFSEYVMASLFQKDTLYRRLGAGHTFLRRFGHAAASGLVVRKFSGDRTINWSNMTGSALGAAVSNAYYPTADPSLGITAGNFAQKVIGAGLGNLAPEFWPDFRHFLTRHYLFPFQTRWRAQAKIHETHLSPNRSCSDSGLCRTHASSVGGPDPWAGPSPGYRSFVSPIRTDLPDAANSATRSQQASLVENPASQPAQRSGEDMDISRPAGART